MLNKKILSPVLFFFILWPLNGMATAFISSYNCYLNSSEQHRYKNYLLDFKIGKAKTSQEVEQLVEDFDVYDGPYRTFKLQIDHRYHGLYSKKRQAFHNALLDSLIRPHIPSHPLENVSHKTIILMAGPMGAGKSSFLSHLRQTRFKETLSTFIQIDPDYIKKALPEFYEQHHLRSSSLLKKQFPGLSDLQREAILTQSASYVHKESGYLSELLLKVAMDYQKNIIFEGSLKNYEWNKEQIKYFKSLGYHVVIFFIDAPDNIIRHRVKQRAKKEKRDILREEIDRNIKEVRQTIQKLLFDTTESDQPLIDEILEIQNNDYLSFVTDHLAIGATPLLTFTKTKCDLSHFPCE